VRATSKKPEFEDGIHLLHSVAYLIVVITELRWMLRKKSEVVD
jgi:hypothetical protein